jgi:tRNA/tmRNA/rRNA uracil-C5-methylase (TrmA/RlmC/RlmD family)
VIQAIEGSSFSGLRLSDFDSNLSLPRHRWYEFKEGFSEQLVTKAISQVGAGSKRVRVLDPFAGSGTSLVTAGRSGLQAVGIEVNPFLAFAARAKCTNSKWSQKGFKKTLDRILDSSRNEVRSPLEGRSTFTETRQLKNWPEIIKLA